MKKKIDVLNQYEGKKFSIGKQDIKQAIKVGKGAMKTHIQFLIKWPQNFPKAVRDKNTGIIQTLGELGVTPDDLTTYRNVMSEAALLTYHGLNREAGFLMFACLCAMDKWDGMLARHPEFGRESEEGKIYDAGSDKPIDISGNIANIPVLKNNTLRALAIPAFLKNALLHWESFQQRGSPEQQLQLFKDLALKTYTPPTEDEMEDIFEDEEVTTENGANQWGKVKTLIQMLVNCGLLASGTDTFKKIVKNEKHRTAFQVFWIVGSYASIYLAQKSIDSRKPKKKPTQKPELLHQQLVDQEQQEESGQQ